MDLDTNIHINIGVKTSMNTYTQANINIYTNVTQIDAHESGTVGSGFLTVISDPCTPAACLSHHLSTASFSCFVLEELRFCAMLRK